MDIKDLDERVTKLEKEIDKTLKELDEINKAIEWLKKHKLSTNYVPRSERIM